jgi:ABC-2 type transport system permease protein
MRTHWLILRTSIAERLTYRADFAFATLVRFLPIVTQIFLWSAIYAVNTPEAIPTLNGYTYANMVAYYLMAMVGRAFSSMPGLAGGIAREVRDGTVKRYLTQPVDMLAYFFCTRMAHKLVYYLVATVPFVLVFYLCRGYFAGWPDALSLAACAASLVMAFLIGFLLESAIGLLSFWFLEVSSLIFIFMMLNYFLSGHMVPLDWLPAPLFVVAQHLPMAYLAYVPATIALGRYSTNELTVHLLVEFGWVLALWGANRWLFARGLRRYSAFGG